MLLKKHVFFTCYITYFTFIYQIGRSFFNQFLKKSLSTKGSWLYFMFLFHVRAYLIYLTATSLNFIIFSMDHRKITTKSPSEHPKSLPSHPEPPPNHYQPTTRPPLSHLQTTFELSSDHCRTTTKPSSNHCWATPEPMSTQHWTNAGPPPNHCRTTPEQCWTTTEQLPSSKHHQATVSH